ncbi:ArsR/SmtB family transcription factor [Cognatiluteimonas profundi]|uniref:ArsR/SmtB family transcription factor n=1 Tax=Cognatiluteimonas profundi TaxID=2594501 RepID=UPI00131CF12C|nr:metalloregulator ArsR/SmtB family transcription factor [Lysobacter profundi]
MPRRPSRSVSTAERMRAHAGDAARLLKTLGNEKRLMILCLLVDGERSVGDLNAQLDLSQSALSQHLALLRADGLVQTRREAQTILYSLADGPSRQIIATLHDVYCIDDRALCGERP